MPRPNPGRSLYAERNLAERIGLELKERGWTYEATAAHLAEVGCPIQPSGVYKIVKQGRRVTVDELVAFSRVFGLDVDNLLLGAAGAPNARFAELLKAYDEAQFAAARAVAVATEAARAIYAFARAEGGGFMRAVEHLEADGLIVSPDLEQEIAAVARDDAPLDLPGVPPWDRPDFKED
ncbi:hypothetical protein Xcel_2072 [Xylanimonas cellulosilytica DSM 15894]|uniref:Uncharacterized protein n=1 Tax=Xylanimonas cellulosilytica (strain DSM 15894 / JCM 12276 / CECT 5975 / KCTC 9989 / LMG 20990 / NBRC 107835 / XIL07) TaxID=446471 RepID=D1BU77_XYLCX|nr:helix-turn-helix transcriptional regulator [Xylanimonas cellulosilytica]ACZ31090.1 hypothetical protein Xcel_2072 [Xylanimonas cellulosilytica DSM 15894]